MLDDIPTWAWIIILMQGWTLVTVFRVWKTLDSNYERIMRQLRPDVYREMED